ncbi:MAG: hypothetical protein FJ315_08525, partial [SAR202 cluster bacterium]|nr:hypothetical protein [SAR202 cluster bacterium]
MALWRLAWRQARGAGALALVASLGVLLAVALLAVGPIYLGALERLAFDQSLRDLRNNFHPQVFVPYSTFQPDEYQRARNTVGEASRAALGRTVEDQGAYASTRLMQARPEDPPGFQAPAFLQYRSDLADHIQVIEGRLPGAGTGTLIEVA